MDKRNVVKRFVRVVMWRLSVLQVLLLLWSTPWFVWMRVPSRSVDSSPSVPGGRVSMLKGQLAWLHGDYTKL